MIYSHSLDEPKIMAPEAWDKANESTARAKPAKIYPASMYICFEIRS